MTSENEQSGGPLRELVTCDSACLALMDATVVADVWEDFLYDGHDHDHAAAGLMILPAAIGTHVSWGGYFPYQVLRDEGGKARELLVDLDPYHEEIPHHGFVMGTDVFSGWTAPVFIKLESDTAVFGDPSAIEDTESTGYLTEIVWPAPGGYLRASVNMDNGVRKSLRLEWLTADQVLTS